MPDYRTRYATLTARALELLVDRVQAPQDRPGEAEARRQAVYVLAEALPQPALWPAVREALAVLAPKMEQAGHREDWIALLEAALDRARTEQDQAAEALILYHLGILYRLQDRYLDAEEALKASAALYTDLGDERNRAAVLSRQAYLAWTQRDFQRARDLAEAVLATAQGASGTEDARAYARLVLGAIAYEARDWETAYEHFQTTYDLWTQLGDQRMVGTALLNRALALQQMERYAEALALYEDMLALMDAIGDIRNWGIANLNLGILHRRRGAHEDALAAYRQAERVFRRLHNRLLLARVYNNIGEIYRDLHRWAEAEQAYALSIQEWQAVGNVTEEVNTWDNLVGCLLAQGRWQEAEPILDHAQKLLATIPQDPAYGHLAATLQEKRAELEAALGQRCGAPPQGG